MSGVDEGRWKAKLAKSELIKANLRLVVSICEKIYQQGPAISGFDPGEAISA